MGLKYDPDVIEIYRHIDVPNENAMIQTLYFGDDYCIKNKKVTRKTDKSNVLRQYKRPAGKVKISESVSISNSFSASGGIMAQLSRQKFNIFIRTKFTLVVRSDNFFRFFFEPVNLHGKLTDLFSVFSFFLAFFGKFFPEIVFSLIIESKRSISKEFFLPVTKEIWLDMYFTNYFYFS